MIAVMLYATFLVAGSAWTTSLMEQNICPAVAAVPLLALLGYDIMLRSERLRGKRAERGP